MNSSVRRFIVCGAVVCALWGHVVADAAGDDDSPFARGEFADTRFADTQTEAIDFDAAAEADALSQPDPNQPAELFPNFAPPPADADPAAGPLLYQRMPVEHIFGPAAETEDYPTVKLGGFLQADGAWFDQDAANARAVGNIPDGADFRRVRLWGIGSVRENVNYQVEMDFAFPGRPNFQNVFLELAELPVVGNLRIGRWKQPFMLETVTSVRFLTFMERALPFAFAPFRHTGIGFYDWSDDETLTWAASLFRNGDDNFGGDVGDGGYAFVGRLTGLPWYEDDGERLVHVGAAYTFRNPDENLSRFFSIPEVFVAADRDAVTRQPPGGTPLFVDTGLIRTSDWQVVGLEGAWVEGSLSLQSELMFASVNQTRGPDIVFPGAYIMGSYFLTGEHRQYNRRLGAFDRQIVYDEFLSRRYQLARGRGAWELTARWSYLDLNDENIRGGRLHDLTLGVNWHLNPHTKLQLNYIRAFLDHPTAGHGIANVLAMRAHVDF